MNTVDVNVKVLREGCLPEYQHITDAATDCRANLNEEVCLDAWGKITIPLGFALELPDGWKAVIDPRSGLAKKDGVYVVHGTIDQDYRGEVGCTLINHTNNPLHIKPFDRICQISFEPYWHASFNMVKKLKETERGEKGFGSTGLN